MEEIEKILNTARSFYLAAKRNDEQRPLPNNQFEMLLVPAATNRAFSIELYLKALLVKEGSPSRGHKLHELFNKLKPETQVKIINNTQLSDQEFAQHINAITNLFVEWRYIFEMEQISLSYKFLRDLADSVQMVSNE